MYEKIKELCKARKITIADLEQAAGLGTRTIYRWDINAPSFDKVVAVADALGISLDELAGRPTRVPQVALAEKELLDAFRDLNDEAQAFLLDQAKLFASSGKYKKAPSAASA